MYFWCGIGKEMSVKYVVSGKQFSFYLCKSVLIIATILENI